MIVALLILAVLSFLVLCAIASSLSTLAENDTVRLERERDVWPLESKRGQPR